MLTDTDINGYAEDIIKGISSWMEKYYKDIKIVYQFKIKEYDAPNVLIEVFVWDIKNILQLQGIVNTCKMFDCHRYVKEMNDGIIKNIEVISNESGPHSSTQSRLENSSIKTIYYRPDFEMINFEIQVIERDSKKEKEQADKLMKELENRRKEFKDKMNKKYSK